MKQNITNAEYAVLGLLFERPCHGYDLDRLIEERGMRAWTELAFSSIYFILNKLQKRELAESFPDPDKQTRKIYRPTAKAADVFEEATISALSNPHPLYPSILLGLANWTSLDTAAAMAALNARLAALEAILHDVSSKAQTVTPMPAHINALFSYSTSQLQCEIDWLKQTMKQLGDQNEQD